MDYPPVLASNGPHGGALYALVAGTAQSVVEVIDVPSWTVESSAALGNDDVRSIDVHPDGQVFVANVTRNAVVIYLGGSESGEVSLDVAGLQGPADLAFREAPEQLIAATQTGLAVIETGAQIEYQYWNEPVVAVSVDSSGGIAGTGATEGWLEESSGASTPLTLGTACTPSAIDVVSWGAVAAIWNPACTALHIFTVTTSVQVATVSIPAGPGLLPGANNRMLFAGPERIFLATSGGTIAVSPVSGSVAAVAGIPDTPTALASTPDGASVWVATISGVGIGIEEYRPSTQELATVLQRPGLYVRDLRYLDRPPRFDDPSYDETWSAADETISRTVVASDADGDLITYSAQGLPAGATYDQGTQTFEWTVSCADEGLYTVSFYARAGRWTTREDVDVEVYCRLGEGCSCKKLLQNLGLASNVSLLPLAFGLGLILARWRVGRRR